MPEEQTMFIVFRDEEEYRWRLMSKEGAEICVSRRYGSLEDAELGIRELSYAISEAQETRPVMTVEG